MTQLICSCCGNAYDLDYDDGCSFGELVDGCLKEGCTC